MALMVTDRLPLPLPTSLVVRVPLPGPLLEKVWVTVELRVADPLFDSALTEGGWVPMDA